MTVWANLNAILKGSSGVHDVIFVGARYFERISEDFIDFEGSIRHHLKRHSWSGFGSR